MEFDLKKVSDFESENVARLKNSQPFDWESLQVANSILISFFLNFFNKKMDPLTLIVMSIK